MRRDIAAYLFVGVGFVLNGIHAHAATVNAASCSRAAVNTAITIASAGDTVTIPPCSATSWASDIPVTKTLTIQGAGIDNTIIRDHGFGFVGGLKNWVLTGITFDGNWGSAFLVSIYKDGSRNGSKDFRIHHNKFKNKTYSTNGTVLVDGFSYGVIDHNTFQDCLDEILSIGGDGAPSYSRTPVVGGYTNGTIFIENNNFLLTAACQAYFGGNTTSISENIFDGNSGSRIVFRYNKVADYTYCRWEKAIETHGFESEFSTVGDARGVYSVEIYNNTFTKNYHSGSIAIKLRGLAGGGIIYNNTFTGAGSSFNNFVFMTNYRSSPSEGTGSVGHTAVNAAGYSYWAHTADGRYICEHCGGHTGLVFGQVNNLYIWGNTGAGSVLVSSSDYVPNDIILNTHYFLSAMPGYTPYTYPHPLVSIKKLSPIERNSIIIK